MVESHRRGMLATHVVGVKVHGKETHMFVDLSQYQHDANLTLNCMLQGLQNSFPNGLPPKLYIQLDNTTRYYFIQFA